MSNTPLRSAIADEPYIFWYKIVKFSRNILTDIVKTQGSRCETINLKIKLYENLLVKPPIYQSHLLHTIILDVVDP